MYCLLYSRDEDLRALYCIPASWLFLQQFFFVFFVFFFFFCLLFLLCLAFKVFVFSSYTGPKELQQFQHSPFSNHSRKMDKFPTIRTPLIMAKILVTANPACYFCFVLFFMLGQSTGFFSEKVFSSFFLRKN